MLTSPSDPERIPVAFPLESLAEFEGWFDNLVALLNCGFSSVPKDRQSFSPSYSTDPPHCSS